MAERGGVVVGLALGYCFGRLLLRRPKKTMLSRRELLCCWVCGRWRNGWRRGACPVWEMEVQRRLTSMGEEEEEAGR